MIYGQVIYFGATVTVGVVRVYPGEISVRINTRARVCRWPRASCRTRALTCSVAIDKSSRRQVTRQTRESSCISGRARSSLVKSRYLQDREHFILHSSFWHLDPSEKKFLIELIRLTPRISAPSTQSSLILSNLKLKDHCRFQCSRALKF